MDGSDGEIGIGVLGLVKYGLLIGQIVPDTKLVVSGWVRPVSRVVSGLALWIGVQTQTLLYALCRVDPDPIGRGLDCVRIEFFSYMFSTIHLTQLI